MNLTVCLPSLLWPESLIEEATRGLNAPALARLIDGAAEGHREAMPLESWLALRLGVPVSDANALAAPCAGADGLDSGEAYWLFAEPAHFAVGHDDVEFAQLLALNAEEARDLIALLDAHFLDDGISFVRGTSGRIYARLARTPAVSFSPPRLALHRPVRAHMPQGPESRQWFRWGNEIQMLLHEHALNRRREVANEPAINSVWFWGGGRHFGAIVAAPDRVICENDLVALLSRARGATVEPLPASAAELSAQCPDEAPNLLWLDALDEAYFAGDAERWRAELARLDQQWLAPLAADFDTGRIGELTLVLGGRESSLRLNCRRRTRLARWLPRRAPAASAVLQGLSAA